jgi:adenosylmethionine-8-amino-7-oxononanoate aminotransferase
MSDLLQRDQKYVWHPFTQMHTAPEPLPIMRAKDAILYTEDGREYIDCNSSWWVNIHGHGNEYIAKAIAAQLETLDHVIFAGVTHPAAVDLSERIIRLLPHPLTRVFFSDDGSTSVEVALKMAFQFWFNQGTPRHRVLALDGAYHGDTFGAMSVGQRDYFNSPFEQFFFDVDFLDFPVESNYAPLLSKADELFSTNEFAALIVEPLVQGSAGMRMYSATFLDDLTALAQKHGVKVIFDEVMTAWGRTGTLFAMDQCQVKPDIVCLSKGLTGGVLPLGLTVASDEMYEAFLSDEKVKAFLHGHSFTGNPLCCAAALANLDLFEKQETKDNIQRISLLNQQFTSELALLRGVNEARHLGTIVAVELTDHSNKAYFSSLRDLAYDFFIERGFLIRPCGNVIFLNPPYCITNEQLQKSYKVIREFIEEIFPTD